MNLPAFTAEAALYRSHAYRAVPSLAPGAGVTAQAVICYTDGAVCGWQLNQRVPGNNADNFGIYQCGGAGQAAQSMGSCASGCARPEGGGNSYCL